MKLPLTTRDLLSVAVLAGGGAAFAAAERSSQKLAPWDGMWWAVTTASTVGYGDIAPRTVAGRLIGAGIMLQQLVATRREATREHDELRARLDEIARRLEALERRPR